MKQLAQSHITSRWRSEEQKLVVQAPPCFPCAGLYLYLMQHAGEKQSVLYVWLCLLFLSLPEGSMWAFRAVNASGCSISDITVIIFLIVELWQYFEILYAPSLSL